MAMTADDIHGRRLVRLGQILKIFLEKDRISTTWLSTHFQTTARTIQRDLLTLKTSGFPLKELSKGYYQIDKTLLKNFEVFDDAELALVIAVKNIVTQLGEPFQKAADDIFSKLYDHVTTSPVVIKIDDSVSVDGLQFNRIVKAIREKRQGIFEYEGSSPFEVTIEPYRVCFFDGFWYLVGEDTADHTLKRYALDKIKNFKPLRSTFRSVPVEIDRMIQESGNIWFASARTLEVAIEVDKEAAHYFRRRTVFPHQEITEERSEGSIIVSFKVGSLNEITNNLKIWIPHIKIIRPEELKSNFLAMIEGWLASQ